jgi:hypothetical protein
MDETEQISEKESERAALQEEAARIVRIASSEGRPLAADEDAHVLSLMARVRKLDEEIHYLTRHRAKARGSERG